MSRTIVIVGFGPGVSTAVAEKFGAEGFGVALVARSEQRLSDGVSALKAKGIRATGTSADASDSVAIRGAIATARAELGPITALLWNAFGGGELGDLTTADPTIGQGIFNLAVIGLLSAVQEALPDMKAAGDGAILVTNGALGDLSPQVDDFAIMLNVTGVALGNAAKAKLVGLLAQRLKPEGVYVGEVTIGGAIKGTPTEMPNSIPGSTVADKFWELYEARSDVRARVS